MLRGWAPWPSCLFLGHSPQSLWRTLADDPTSLLGTLPWYWFGDGRECPLLLAHQAALPSAWAVWSEDVSGLLAALVCH